MLCNRQANFGCGCFLQPYDVKDKLNWNKYKYIIKYTSHNFIKVPPQQYVFIKNKYAHFVPHLMFTNFRKVYRFQSNVIYLILIKYVLIEKIDRLILWAIPCLLCKNYFPKGISLSIKSYLFYSYKICSYRKNKSVHFVRHPLFTL